MLVSVPKAEMHLLVVVQLWRNLNSYYEVYVTRKILISPQPSTYRSTHEYRFYLKWTTCFWCGVRTQWPACQNFETSPEPKLHYFFVVPLLQLRFSLSHAQKPAIMFNLSEVRFQRVSHCVILKERVWWGEPKKLVSSLNFLASQVRPAEVMTQHPHIPQSHILLKK